jgi:hypothetical protein
MLVVRSRGTRLTYRYGRWGQKTRKSVCPNSVELRLFGSGCFVASSADLGEHRSITEEPIMQIPTPVAAGIAALSALAVTAAFVPGPATATSSPGSVTSVQVQDQHRAPGSYTSKVRGTFGENGVVRGTFKAQRFFVKHGEVVAQGILQAKLRRGNGQVVGTTHRQIVIPVKNATTQQAGRGGSCDILNLVLGPLDLNLLGLEVHLKKVILDIVATSGAGNLLGNLLCAVAGLLDGPSLLDRLRLSNILNRILSLLG